MVWGRLAHQAAPCSFAQKIRTVELDGKVIKLQIVSLVGCGSTSPRAQGLCVSPPATPRPFPAL